MGINLEFTHLRQIVTVLSYEGLEALLEEYTFFEPETKDMATIQFVDYDESDIPLTYEIGRRHRQKVGNDYDNSPEAEIFLIYLQLAFEGTILRSDYIERIRGIAREYFQTEPTKRDDKATTKAVTECIESYWKEDNPTTKEEVMNIIASTQLQFYSASRVWGCDYRLSNSKEEEYLRHFNDAVSFISRFYEP